MHKIHIRFLQVFILISATLGCAEKATEPEIDEMCTHLLELRNKTGDQEMKAACVAEARTESVTKRQARCRISAVNAQEYWNRCRTGEARPK